MGRGAIYRAMVFDDERDIRVLLRNNLSMRGYEVYTFSNPGICPQYEMTQCPCPLDQSCTDVIISDLNMPISFGLDFVAKQMEKGCNCEHIALMSAGWEDESLSEAKSMGTKVLFKEKLFEEVDRWLVDIEQSLNPQRRLSDWWLYEYVSPDNNDA